VEHGPSGDRCEFDRARLLVLYLGLSLLSSADSCYSGHHELECPDKWWCDDFSVCILHILRKASVHGTSSVGEKVFLSLRLIRCYGTRSCGYKLLADEQIKKIESQRLQTFVCDADFVPGIFDRD